MQSWTATAITADLQVRLSREMQKLPPALDEEVEVTWQAALRANPGLFNGRIFSADRISPRSIEGHWTEYRRAVAQMARPELANDLGLRPLAVCGVLVFWHQGRRAVLFGRRSVRTTYQQGLWQLPPAGSVDFKAGDPDGSVDVRRALLAELREEVGLTADCVERIAPLCAVEHPGTHVTDLGFALHTDLDSAVVLAAQAGCGDTEYTDVHAVFLDDVFQQIRAWGDEVVASAALFLRHL